MGFWSEKKVFLARYNNIEEKKEPDSHEHGINSMHTQDLIDSNFIDLCGKLSLLSGSGQKDDKYFSWAKNPFDDWFSRVFKINFSENMIKEGVEYLRSVIESGEAPGSLLLTEGSYNGAVSDLLKLNKFSMFYEQTGMYLDLSNVNWSTSDNPQIRVIESSSELNKWNDVIEQVFSKRKNSELYNKLLSEEDFTFFACFDQQRVIATAMLFMKNEIAGVHLVGTLKEFRKKGIGTRMTKKAFEFAKSKGAKTGVLQASPIGKNMYKEIGFQEYSRIAHWKYNY